MLTPNKFLEFVRLAFLNWRHLLREGTRAPTVSRGGTRRRAAAAFAASISFEDVKKEYGPFGVHGASLDVAAGEVVCLLGPSGCGKTTLLRLASGIERPSGGRVLLDGQEVAGPNRFVPPEKRSVGLMFQDFALFPHLTNLQNVAFGLSALARDDAVREAFAALERVGLADYAQEYPHVLSGGQQQRVALARAIVPRPAVILMDEPFSGLDVQLRDQIRVETQALLRETRSTCILVTHEPDEAMQLGDRIAVMQAGRVIQVGTGEELYHAPSDLFVARLFSQINEVPGTVMDGEVATPFGRFRAGGHRNGANVILCIRQRAVRARALSDDKNGAGIAGRVLAARFQGDLSALDIGVSGLDQPLTTLVRGTNAPKVGDDVLVTVDPAGAMVFSAESGR